MPGRYLFLMSFCRTLAVLVNCECGYLVDHEQAINQDVKPLRYVCRHGLFDLWRPYINENQSTSEQTTGAKRKRKKQRTSPFNEQELEAVENHNKIRDILDKSSSHIVSLGRKAGYFKENNTNNNSCTGFIDNDISPTDKVFSSHVVEHSSNSPSLVHLQVGWYIIPPRTNYLMSDDLTLQPLIDHVYSHGLFDVVVMDPPWYNKSAKRNAKYSFLSLWQIKSLPVPQLLRNQGVVIVWVTNKPKYINFTKGELFSHWGVQYLAEWHWVKVTRTGELVMDLDSLHKRPYETLIVGRYDSTTTSDNTVQQESHVNNNKHNGNSVIDDPCEVSIHGSTECTNPQHSCTQQETKTNTTKADVNNEELLPPQDIVTKTNTTKADVNNEELLPPQDIVTKTNTAKADVDDKELLPQQDIVTKTNTAKADVNNEELLPPQDIVTKTNTAKADVDDKELLPQQDIDNHFNHDAHPQYTKATKAIPDNLVICSVPCQIHSRKPQLNDILLDFVHPQARCLEMFARNLTTGWTSWGNEVLKFQHTDYFDIKLESQDKQHLTSPEQL